MINLKAGVAVHVGTLQSQSLKNHDVKQILHTARRTKEPTSQPKGGNYAMRWAMKEQERLRLKNMHGEGKQHLIHKNLTKEGQKKRKSPKQRNAWITNFLFLAGPGQRKAAHPSAISKPLADLRDAHCNKPLPPAAPQQGGGSPEGNQSTARVRRARFLPLSSLT